MDLLNCKDADKHPRKKYKSDPPFGGMRSDMSKYCQNSQILSKILV